MLAAFGIFSKEELVYLLKAGWVTRHMSNYITHKCNVCSGFRDALSHGGLTFDMDVEYPAKPEHLVWSTGSSPLERGERRCHVRTKLSYGTLKCTSLIN